MTQYIDKSALVAEIERRRDLHYKYYMKNGAGSIAECKYDEDRDILSLLDTLDVKEVDWEKERMDECPYRQVGCTMYEDTILECNGACSWVVDYPKLKELKAQKGE